MDAAKAFTFLEKDKAVPAENSVFGENSKGRRRRCEVDTSAPFGSVKEAVDRFGGSAVWNSQLRMLFLPEKRHCVEEFKVLNVEEQSMQLQKEETSEVNKISQKEKEDLFIGGAVNAGTDRGQSSGSILDELELAKLNLSRTTCDLTKLRAFIEALYNEIYNEIESERTTQGKTPEKLSSLGTIVSFLEEDLRKTTLKLQITKEANDNWNRRGDTANNISREIEQLKTQTEQFRQTAAAAKSEASNLTCEIEQMQAGIKTAEIRWLAAKKMEEAAKAAEAVALARIKDIMSNNSTTLVLPVEENVMLVTDEFEEHYQTSNLSKLELLANVKEAAAEVKTSRKMLEDALNHLEASKSGKFAAEGALWTSSTKFKNSYSRMLEFNGFNLASHTSKCGIKHAVSIGEILSKKLMGLEKYEHAIREIRERPDEKAAKVSLGQLLNRKPVSGFACKQQPLKKKRKKFGFVGLS